MDVTFRRGKKQNRTVKPVILQKGERCSLCHLQRQQKNLHLSSSITLNHPAKRWIRCSSFRTRIQGIKSHFLHRKTYFLKRKPLKIIHLFKQHERKIIYFIERTYFSFLSTEVLPNFVATKQIFKNVSRTNFY